MVDPTLIALPLVGAGSFTLGYLVALSPVAHLRGQLKAQRRATIMALEAGMKPAAPPPMTRAERGSKGAAMTNAKRRTRREAQRQRVLEVCEQMRRDMAAKRAAAAEPERIAA